MGTDSRCVGHVENPGIVANVRCPPRHQDSQVDHFQCVASLLSLAHRNPNLLVTFAGAHFARLSLGLLVVSSSFLVSAYFS